MYTVYIIYSDSINRYYIGVTSHLEHRVFSHNAGFSQKAFTKRASDWRVVYREEFAEKKQAFGREKEIKSYKGGNSFKALLGL